MARGRDLGLLYPNYTSSTKNFICPSAKDRNFEFKCQSGDKKDYPFEAIKPTDNKQVISYAYCYARTRRGPRAWHEEDRDTVRLLADKKAGTAIDGDEARRANHWSRPS